MRDNSAQAAVAEAFVEKGAWVSLLALAEATWVLACNYELTPAEIATAIQMLLQQNDLVFQDSPTIISALDLFRSKPALGFTDCLILEMAKRAGHLPLGTFDTNLSKIEGAQRM